MTRDEQEMRFEELDAGRALGDLDAAEAAEWEALAKTLGKGGDSAFDAIVGAMEERSPVVDLPASLVARLKKSEYPPVARSRMAIGPWVGWALAACLLGLLVIRSGNTPPEVPSPAERRDALLGEAGGLIRLPFAGEGARYSSAEGEVVWSDSHQEGFMTLAHLPANDPAKSQYQLWIVDPERDEFPVDGGVFDIPASGPVVIPIDAKLPVKSPAAFVITLEKPGGVVRSKQEVVVAIAKS